jgi:glycosyltransferase involved in cell wall biosynthesis
MSLRVAFIIPTMDRGGAEKQLAMLATGLPRDHFDPHVLLLTRDGPRSEELRQHGIAITVIGKRFKADPTALWRLKRELQKLKPDLVHTWIFAANAFGRVAAQMAGVPRILASERCVDPWKTYWHHQIDRYLAKKTEAITTNSSGVRDFYVQHGIAPELFRIIPNGIVPRQPSSISRQEAFDRLQVNPNHRLILAVGRLWPQKRYRDLIWSAELLGTLLENTTLVIIGDGPQEAELLRHRDDVSRSDRVRFAGSREDVADLLPHADIFWNGSEYEGQSNSLIEAMQAGLPVVATNIPGNRDLVIPDETGLLFKLGDTADLARQTRRILDDPQWAQRMSQAAQQRIASEFSVEKMIDRHVALYQNR